MASESEGPSRAASEPLSETGGDATGDERTGSPAPNQENESIVTDLPVMHTAKRLKIEARKLDGMQRELYSLMGDNTAPVMVAPSSKFKTRPEWQQKATAWSLTEFKPKDSLALKHWVRASALADGTAGSRFSRFNTPVNVPEWNDEDYEAFKSEEWSLEETKYLFDLARSYDLRWLVIADRYSFDTKNRTVEDLKERYYEVCSSLIKSKATTELGLSPYSEELLKSMKYDKEAEQTRKTHMERLLSRTPKEVAEEEALVLEARRLESMAERIVSERKNLFQLLESPAPLNNKTTKADLSTSQGIGQLLQELQNEKSRKAATPAPATPAYTGTHAARAAVSAAVSKVLSRKVTSREEEAIGISYTEPGTIKHPGVYLRSTRLTPVRQNLLAKVRAVTSELDLPIKPVMPTANTCAKYESLYQLITVLLEAKKIQDKLEMEIDVLKRARESSAAAPETGSERAPAAEATKN